MLVEDVLALPFVRSKSYISLIAGCYGPPLTALCYYYLDHDGRYPSLDGGIGILSDTKYRIILHQRGTHAVLKVHYTSRVSKRGNEHCLSLADTMLRCYANSTAWHRKLELDYAPCGSSFLFIRNGRWYCGLFS